MGMYNYLKYDAEFKFIGDKKQGAYRFYNKNKGHKLNSTSFECIFSIHYEALADIYLRNIRKIDRKLYTDEEIDKIEMAFEEKGAKESDINYATIEGLYINPRGTGIGTELMGNFIEELRKINKIEYVFLTPKNDDARRFWSKLGFVNVYVWKKSIQLMSTSIMALDLKNYPECKIPKRDDMYVL